MHIFSLYRETLGIGLKHIQLNYSKSAPPTKNKRLGCRNFNYNNFFELLKIKSIKWVIRGL